MGMEEGANQYGYASIGRAGSTETSQVIRWFFSANSAWAYAPECGDPDRSAAFYQELGLELTADLYNQARFLSWDGYHHHLGINVWAGRNASRLEPDMYGLDFFEISRPGLKPGTFQDPDGVKVVVDAVE